LTAVSGRRDDFAQRECEVLGISTDPLATHEDWIGKPAAQGGLGGLNFPLAADEDGAVCQAYGVYVPRQHVALRGLFIIDPNGVLQYQVIHNLSLGRNTDEVLRVLDGLQVGGLCPADWQPHQPSFDPAHTLGPNRVVGQYRIEAVLGSGAFSVVFRAQDLTLERPVALKVIRQELARSADAVLAEARSAAALNHANIAIIYAVDTSPGFPMIVMEYVEGEPLSKLLEAGPLAPPRVGRLARQIALGTAAAHAHNIVHGDLKPANVMVTSTDLIKIMDFGLARKYRPALSDETLDAPQSPLGVSGTPSYMSPEQSRGEPLTPSSDVFSFGLVLFEMLTGRRAIDGAHLLEVLHRIERIDSAALAEQVPPPFADIVRRALAPVPEQRTLRMDAIAALLEEQA
jgi:serine/threonine protein kinase/peroxiredoxin